MSRIFSLIRERCLNLAQRSFSAMSNGEQKIHDVLKVSFPKAQTISVQDISGGCGAMYEVMVVSPEFGGLKLIKQHMLVNKALKSEIQDMHGIRITTKTNTNEPSNP